MLLTLLALAQAADPALVLARVDEVAPLRPQRIDEDAPPIDRDVYVRAAEGKVVTGLTQVEGVAAHKTWGVGVFDVPMHRYWAAVNDDLSKVEWTDLDHVEILEGTPCEAPRKVFQFLSVPLITDRWWTVDVVENPALAASSGGRLQEQVWTGTPPFEPTTETTRAWASKGITIASTQGSWFLIDLDGRSTLVEYYTWADPGGSIPAGFASRLAANGVDSTLEKMAALAAHGPTCLAR